MVSPGYSYSKAPDQTNFLVRQRTRELFRTDLQPAQASLAIQSNAPFHSLPDGGRRV